jgi:UPF0755 protein
MGFKPRQWLVYFLLFVGVVLIGGFFWWQWVTQPVNQGETVEKKEIFVIKKGESLDEIAFGLREKNLIKSPFAFRVWVLAQGLTKTIQAGDFRLTPGMSLEEIVNQLTHGTLDIWVTIPEGWRSEQIAERLIKEGLGINFKNWNLKIENSRLEGYLFPDTYLFPKDASQERIIEIMKGNFDKKVTSQLKKEAAKKELTFHQVITLASIVEREAKFSKDRPIIAGILIKRWQNSWLLQADAAVQYAVASINYQLSTISDNIDWWPKNLTKKDLEIDSPYNTYKYQGLPPGPICNPGLASIEATVDYEDSPYWFYLSDSQGRMHYAKTIEEHNTNVAKYLGK